PSCSCLYDHDPLHSHLPSFPTRRSSNLPRHHSFAVMPAPHMGPGIVHIMLEVAEMDMVAQAMERTTEHGFGISSTLGRHTNDKMVSYYLRAPGGWDIEFGYDGLMVDEDPYLPQNITADS